MLDAVVEELALKRDDTRGDFLDGLLPLVDRLDQPAGRPERNLSLTYERVSLEV